MRKSIYDDEFKERIAKMVIEGGRSATGLADEMNINKNSVCKWVNEYRKRNGMKMPARAAIAEEKAKIKELEKQLNKKEQELKDREMEIEILKKAVHIFIRDQDTR